jgi:hypothetical protein
MSRAPGFEHDVSPTAQVGVEHGNTMNEQGRPFRHPMDDRVTALLHAAVSRQSAARRGSR